MHQKADTETDRTQEPQRRLDLSVPQVAGSALAAVAAAVLASRLGVYGTIIGAGVVSVVATCGGSVFQHLFSRTGEQIREATVQGRPAGGQPSGVIGPGPDRTQRLPSYTGEFTTATTHGTRVRGWRRPLIAAAVVFGVSMGGVTAYELASGSELSGGKGTTFGSVVRGDDAGGRSGPADAPSTSPDERDDEQSRDPGQRQSPHPGGTGSPNADADEPPSGSKTPSNPDPDEGGASGAGEAGQGSGEEKPEGGTTGGSTAPDGPADSPEPPPADGQAPAPAPSPPAPRTNGAE
ncbi:hypothetical protein [Streptomyces albipurpureus]|uniref:Uncharacterized protein n=1 Tax=Streptomyces albipurpureus TaxID=2897419 RepID=A0ABT0UEW2_9ACTN|nr:hypothetical protein [Streptomyces sp. CWNU-1]MCM2387118.1 hypothetical protein [Streptomyces sp. CWNU-1]